MFRMRRRSLRFLCLFIFRARLRLVESRRTDRGTSALAGTGTAAAYATGRAPSGASAGRTMPAACEAGTWKHCTGAHINCGTATASGARTPRRAPKRATTDAVNAMRLPVRGTRHAQAGCGRWVIGGW